jgi:asparagine synthase (glutamine-hydrolysing)
MLTGLPDDMLVKVDRASMAVGLEVRVPFLDHRLVEFAWRLPLSTKIRNRQGKWILRQMLYDFVPKSLVERPKMGFSIPFGAWLRGRLRGWGESLLDEKQMKADGLLNVAAVRSAWIRHIKGQGDWSYPLWGVLMFQAWKKKWIG